MRFFAAITVLAFPALIAADKPNHKRYLTSLVTDTAKSAIKSARSRSLLSDSDMDMTDMGPMICGLIEGGMQDDPSVQDEMEGLECECESTDTELTLECDVTEKMCDVEYGCIDAGSFEFTMPYMGGDATFEVCMTYANDDETPSFARGKEFCFEGVMNLDLTTMMDGTEDVSMLKSCKATFGDPLQPEDCVCEVCGKDSVVWQPTNDNADNETSPDDESTGPVLVEDYDGKPSLGWEDGPSDYPMTKEDTDSTSDIGFKVDCGNGIKSECTDFMDDGSSGSEGAALPGSSGMPVMKLQEETATATDSTGEEKTATTDPDSTSGGSYASAPIVASAAGLTMAISALM